MLAAAGVVEAAAKVSGYRSVWVFGVRLGPVPAVELVGRIAAEAGAGLAVAAELGLDTLADELLPVLVTADKRPETVGRIVGAAVVGKVEESSVVVPAGILAVEGQRTADAGKVAGTAEGLQMVPQFDGGVEKDGVEPLHVAAFAAVLAQRGEVESLQLVVVASRGLQVDLWVVQCWHCHCSLDYRHHAPMVLRH